MSMLLYLRCIHETPHEDDRLVLLFSHAVFRCLGDNDADEGFRDEEGSESDTVRQGRREGNLRAISSGKKRGRSSQRKADNMSNAITSAFKTYIDVAMARLIQDVST